MTSAKEKPDQEELFARAARVKLLVFDVDGVLTDRSLFYGPNGEAMKRFDVRDGHGIVMARELGLPSAILTARVSPMVQKRAEELKLVETVQGRRDKRVALIEILARQNITPDDCAYMGDDVNDLAPMGHVGLPACPSDAATEVRQNARFIARSAGGHGAARELVELCLKARGRWQEALDLCDS